MKPIDFKEKIVDFAKDQDKYQTLPAWKDEEGQVISCWKLTLMERIKLLIQGKIWVRQYTFNKALQPQLLQIEYPFEQ